MPHYELHYLLRRQIHDNTRKKVCQTTCGINPYCRRMLPRFAVSLAERTVPEVHRRAPRIAQRPPWIWRSDAPRVAVGPSSEPRSMTQRCNGAQSRRGKPMLTRSSRSTPTITASRGDDSMGSCHRRGTAQSGLDQTGAALLAHAVAVAANSDDEAVAQQASRIAVATTGSPNTMVAADRCPRS